MAKYPAATWRPGPLEKQGYPGAAVNADRGVVCHSMVGYIGGALIELDKLTRRASWHFSVLQNGDVLQHYDTIAVTWHAGSRQQNARLIGIEHEGGYRPENEPLTPKQLAASVALVEWLSQQHSFPRVRGVGLFEHNEIAPATDPTACPSHRIPWEHYIEQEDDMKPFLVLEGGSPNTWLIGFEKPILIGSQQELNSLKATLGEPKIALSKATIDQMVVA